MAWDDIQTGLDNITNIEWNDMVAYVKGLVTGVSSVFGRTGAVTATTGDYTASEVTNVPSGTVSSTDVQGAVDELEVDVAANNAKVSNADHTGEVTGSAALTINKTAITGRGEVGAAAADYVLISDTDDAGTLKKALVSSIAGGGSPRARVQLFASGADIATDNVAQYPALHNYTAPTDGHPESFSLAFDDTRTERGNWDTELPAVAATATIRVHYRGSGDAGDVRWAIGFIGIDDNENSLTPTEPTLVNFSSDDVVTADTNHRIATATHTFAASVATTKNCRCSVARVPSAETDSMVGDAEFLYLVIEWTVA